MKTIYSILLAISFALFSYFYLKFKTPELSEAEKVQQERSNDSSEEFKPFEEKLELFVSKVKTPDTWPKDQFSSEMNKGSLNSFGDQICVDECGRLEKKFDDYWSVKNEYDLDKLKLKFDEPFTTHGVDFVEIAMDETKSLEELKKLLWKSEILDDDDNSQRQQLKSEVEELFKVLRELTNALSKIKDLKSGDCSPCTNPAFFENFHDKEVLELNAFLTVLEFAKTRK